MNNNLTLIALVWLSLSMSSSATDTLTVIERGPHHNVLQSIQQIDANGELSLQTNSVMQISTGLNYFDDEKNIWLPSSNEIELLDRGAVFRKGQFKLIFASDINDPNGNLEWFPSPNHRIVSQTVGIAITETATGDSIFLGQIKSTQGVLTQPNEVTWPDCFDNIKADVRISINPLGTGFQADVILRERIPNPFQGDARIEIWTQFLSGPEPIVQPGAIQRTAEISDIDTQLAFGQVHIGVGQSFLIGENENEAKQQRRPTVRVAKEYFIDPETQFRFLIESVPYSSAEAAMQALPRPRHTSKVDSNAIERLHASRRAGGQRRHPIALKERQSSAQRKVARIERQTIEEQLGFLMDYTALVTQTNMIFAGDKTYLLPTNAIVNLSGTTVIEPGCVIKMNQYNLTNSTPIINILGPLDCQTRPYAPCVITSRDDFSIGETNTAIRSTVSTNAYGYFHLCFPASNTNAISLHDIRSRYALNAFGFLGANSVEAWNIQTVSTVGEVFAGSGNSLNLRNILVHGSGIVASAKADNTVFNGEHFTIHSASQTYEASSFANCSFNLTNSLIVTVPNTSSVGFTNVGGATLTNDSGVFSVVGAGSHYLSDDTFRNIGLPSISTNLTKGVFRYSTTYCPTILSKTIGEDLLLGPLGICDTYAPDLGYHYPAIDYAFTGLILTNAAKLTLTNGVNVAVYGGVGFSIGPDCMLLSEGKPNRMNHLTRYTTVQEQPMIWGSTTSLQGARPILDCATNSSVRIRFTETSLCALSSGYAGGDFYGANSASDPNTIVVKDSEFYNVRVGGFPNIGAFTNNLFVRCGISTAPLVYTLRNNLFRYSPISYAILPGYAMTVIDNLFDNSSINSFLITTPTNSHNGYINAAQIGGGSNNMVLSKSDYETGPLGRWYYPASGTNLFALVDVGSCTNAGLAGLYHFTTLVAQTKDGATPLDIGYHYSSLGNDGYPSDWDGDGMPDIVEDANGNGISDDDSDWMTKDRNGFSSPIVIDVFTHLE